MYILKCISYILFQTFIILSLNVRSIHDTDPLTSTQNDENVFVPETQFDFNPDKDVPIAGNLKDFMVPETPAERNIITSDLVSE